MQLIDTHCHLDFEVFAADRAQVMARAQALGVEHFIVPAVQQSSWQSLVALFHQQDCVDIALGMHPMFMSAHSEAHIEMLDHALEQQRPLAVGEIGLDFYAPESDRQGQLLLFRAQLQLAAKHQLPVILHVRKAHDEVLQCLRDIPVIAGIVRAPMSVLVAPQPAFATRLADVVGWSLVRVVVDLPVRRLGVLTHAVSRGSCTGLRRARRSWCC